MDKSDCLEKEIEKKLRQKDRQKRKKMKISGQSVFRLKKAIINRTTGN